MRAFSIWCGTGRKLVTDTVTVSPETASYVFLDRELACGRRSAAMYNHCTRLGLRAECSCFGVSCAIMLMWDPIVLKLVSAQGVATLPCWLVPFA